MFEFERQFVDYIYDFWDWEPSEQHEYINLYKQN